MLTGVEKVIFSPSGVEGPADVGGRGTALWPMIKLSYSECCLVLVCVSCLL